MSRCVFCRTVDTHDETCPMVIPTSWGPGTGIWPELARNILEAWRRDSCVYDRGGSADVKTLEDLWERMERALGKGEAEVAMALLFTYYSGPVVDGPSTEGPAQGTPSTEGPPQRGSHRRASTEGPI